MANLLLINDDGADSPTVAPFISALQRSTFCNELSFVLPAEEQSWIAQSITRFRTLFAEDFQIGETSGFLVNGTPADCANLGINNLFRKRPDAVISGINMGSNAGLAFFLSSGTVGGAAEAFLFGVKAIAVSITAPGRVFKAWTLRNVDELQSMQHDFARLSAVAAKVVGMLLDAPIWDKAQLISVNIPWEADHATRAVVTRLAETRFEAFFTEFGKSQFRHDFKALILPPRTEAEAHMFSDIEALDAGLISVNPISYRLSATEVLAPLQALFS